MTTRIPLVIVNGQIEQLQSGDSINVAASSYDAQSLQNATSGAITAGQTVYLSAAASVKLANASALSTSAGVVGMVLDASIAAGQNGNILTEGLITLTVAQWDAVITSNSTGLAFGTTYFLDPATPGNITATAPSTAGQVVVPVGVAISTTTLKFEVGTPILL